MTLLDNKLFLGLGKVLAANYDLEGTLYRILKQLVQHVEPADAGIIFFYNKKRRHLVPQAFYGYPVSDAKFSLHAREGAPGLCYALRKPLLFSTPEAVEEQATTLRPLNLTFRKKIREGLPPVLGMMAIPIKLQEKISGVILLEHYKSQSRNFTESDLLQIETLSSWIGLIIDDVQSRLELRHNKRSYRELLRRFITSGEEDRKMIAREIHDDVNQLLLSVRIDLEGIESTIPADMVNLQERLKVVRSHINQAFDDLHMLSLSLRPPGLDELGIHEALDWYIQNLGREASLPITLEVKGLGHRRVAPIVETELFRIAQEALHNVVRHAKAASATVKLEFTRSSFVLIVEDNGIGFDASSVLSMSGSKRNIGLLGMKERAEICGGNLEIDSSPGYGTKLKVEIPMGSFDWGAY